MSVENTASRTPVRLVRVGIMTLSANRTIETADAEVCSLVGLGEGKSAVGRPLTELIPPAEAADVEALDGGLPLTYLGLASGTMAPLQVHLAQLPGSEGLLVSVTSINAYLAEAQALARVQLRNTVESIVAGFAHEVRNPLAAILSLTEAALLDDPSPDSVLVRIPGLVARVEALIRHALAYSRPKPPQRSLHQASFLLDRSVAMLRKRTNPPRLELSPHDENVPPVMVDLLHGEQVLGNLLENALDAATSVVKVTVSEGRTPVPSVCIEVSDDGPGVADEVVERIFEPFFTTKARGTGLGLAIARDLARMNGGDLRHVKKPLPGATFRAYFPSTAASIRGSW